MDSLAEVDVQDFEAALTRQQLLPLQVVQMGIAAGAVAFAGVVAFLATSGQFGPKEPEPSGLLVVQVLTVAHFAVFCAGYVVGGMLSRAQFSPERLSRAMGKTFRGPTGQAVKDPPGKCLAIIRTATILRLALLDAGATLGLATCLVAQAMGVLGEQPAYWANVATTPILVAYAALTFPTAARVRGIFLDHIAAARRPD